MSKDSEAALSVNASTYESGESDSESETSGSENENVSDAVSDDCSQRSKSESLGGVLVSSAIENLKLSESDLVWGKVSSYPWWPGQVFLDASSVASNKAMKFFKKGTLFVTYFGDCSFGWNDVSKIKPFHHHFAQMVKESDTPEFRNAVGSALGEVSRRVEFGLSCPCVSEVKTRNIMHPGLREESRVRYGEDKVSNAVFFEPEELVEHMTRLACFPRYDESDKLLFVCLRGFIDLVRCPDIEAARLGLQFIELVLRGMPNGEGAKLVEGEDGIDSMEKFQFLVETNLTLGNADAETTPRPDFCCIHQGSATSSQNAEILMINLAGKGFMSGTRASAKNINRQAADISVTPYYSGDDMRSMPITPSALGVEINSNRRNRIRPHSSPRRGLERVRSLEHGASVISEKGFTAVNAWCLTNIAAGKPEALLPALPLLIAHLREQSSVPVAEQCACAIGNVAGEGEELRNVLLSQGALPPLARMIFPDKGSTVRTAAWALSNLIKGPESKAAAQLVRVDGIVDALLRHLKKTDEEIATELSWIVVYLSALSDIATSMLLKGGILQLLVERLATSDSLQLLIPVLRSLCNFFSGDPKAMLIIFMGGQNTGEDVIGVFAKCLRSDHRVLKKLRDLLNTRE